MTATAQMNLIKSHAPAMLELHTPISTFPYILETRNGDVPCTIEFEESVSKNHMSVRMVIVTNDADPRRARVCIAHGTMEGWSRFNSSLGMEFWKNFKSIRQEFDINREMLEACASQLAYDYFDDVMVAHPNGRRFKLSDIKKHLLNTQI